MASQAGQGSRDEGQKTKTKTGLEPGWSIFLTKLKPTKTKPDTIAGRGKPVRKARADKGRRE